MDALKWTILSCFALANIAFYSCNSEKHFPTEPLRTKEVKGLTLVAPPEPFIDDPMTDIIQVGANSIAVVPYAFTPPGQPEVHFGTHHQWWGESPEGVIETINRAHAHHIRVLLKPQVWSHGHWTGDYTFDKPEDWNQWESQYMKYIMYFARIADSLKVDAFCLGTEFKTSIRARPAFWSSLIDSVRNEYSGTLTYAANWDNYENIPFWDKLDIIGINAYFPLSDSKTPSVYELMQCWAPIRSKIKNLQEMYDKPVLFTEYGYLSVDGCAHSTWNLEEEVRDLAVNEQAQANAIEALHRSFYQTDFWLGGYLWKWFPNMKGHEGYPTRDYTPQGKLAEKTILTCFHNKT